MKKKAAAVVDDTLYFITSLNCSY